MEGAMQQAAQEVRQIMGRDYSGLTKGILAGLISSVI